MALFILYRAITLFKKTSILFLQKSPAEINTKYVYDNLLTIQNVLDVHDIHIWSLNGQDHIFTAHIIVKKGISHKEALEVKQAAKTRLMDMSIIHNTIEIEEDGDICLDNNLSF